MSRDDEYEVGVPLRFAAATRATGTWRVLACALLLCGTAWGKPTVHEYIDLPAGEDLEPVMVRATDADELPPPSADSRLQQPGLSSASPAPSGSGTPDPNAASLPERFSIDRDTRRPETASYGDPFTPSVVPFKRTVVYDAVDARGQLHVASKNVRPLRSTAPAGALEEHFHANLELDLRAGVAEPIPSVAPSSWVIARYSTPALPLTLLRDSADNWYVRAERSAQVKLSLQVGADRRSFGSPWPQGVTFAQLAEYVPAVPSTVRARARSVAGTLGLETDTEPARVVSTLVRHFRGFRASEQTPNGEGLDLYSEIALTGRGICRHRAYAFTVTALGLGLPSRYAMNEAHAWVEVFDGKLWHRIDLGGAASDLVQRGPERPSHVEPPDPHPWPPDRGPSFARSRGSSAGSPTGEGPASPASSSEGSGTTSTDSADSASEEGFESYAEEAVKAEEARATGLEEAARAAEEAPEGSASEGPAEASRGAAEQMPSESDMSQTELPEGAPGEGFGAAEASEAAESGAAVGGDQDPSETEATEGSTGSPSEGGEQASASARAPAMPLPPPLPIEIRSLRVSANDSQRGRAIRVEGRTAIAGSRRSCPGARVEVGLRSASESRALGALLADSQGRFSGELVIPWGLPVGNYELVANPAQESCPVGGVSSSATSRPKRERAP